MATPVRISEAASLGMHATVLLVANAGRPMSTAAMAAMMGVSQAHLSKVLQRLARLGLVTSVRGPHGGFLLSRRADQITLGQVYEAIEGPLSPSTCLLGRPICSGRQCILGGVLQRASGEVGRYLDGTMLSELADVYER